MSWKPPPGNVLGYVVEWCDGPQDSPCDLRWESLGPNATSTVIKSGENLPRHHVVPRALQRDR